MLMSYNAGAPAIGKSKQPGREVVLSSPTSLTKAPGVGGAVASRIVPSDSSSIPESTLVLYDAMIALGGGIYRGVQHGMGEPLILFDDASSEPRLTLALPASKLSAHAVIEAIRSKRQRYGNLKP